ncbi:hypothetical protein NM208_g8020 [Fusarium decemcellulare]|uniref:Uncharacterized protein n=1 Tax=Fusarium decemcellulare TaxID=57161 RepID=A0ACC1S764_9HYPO|nr:hypothetical protein NM208_g8020 [Fusarium decemcellulare]
MSDIESIPERWTMAWSSKDPSGFSSLFSPDAKYIDHSFQFETTHLEQHHRIWHRANPDFTVWLDPSMPVWWASVDKEQGNASVCFRTIQTGTFTGNLPSRNASGKAWRFPAMVQMTIENGLIVELNEFYREQFDQGVGVENYMRIDDKRELINMGKED